MDKAGIPKPLLIAEILWLIDGFWELESQFYLRTLVGQLWSKVVQEYIANTNSWVIKEKKDTKLGNECWASDELEGRAERKYDQNT